MVLHSAEPPSDIDTGLACLALLARVHGIAADIGQMSHQFLASGRKSGETEILLAAKHFGLKAGASDSAWSRPA